MFVMLKMPELWNGHPFSVINRLTILYQKKDMGNFNNLIKKSLTNEMFTRIDICKSSHLRTKSIEARPTTIISSPNKTNQIKFISLCLMPISTIDCVKNGIISWSMQPNNKPTII